MLRDSGDARGFRVAWPVEATSTGRPSCDRIAQRLDHLQARLEALEASPAGRDPLTPLAAHHEQELREIRRLVADLTAEVLGADHPLVAPLREERLRPQRPPGVVA